MKKIHTTLAASAMMILSATPCVRALDGHDIVTADSLASMTLQTHTADEIKSARLKHDQKIITLGSASAPDAARLDSIRKLVDLFYYDQYRHFQDPEAPYFMFMSKDAKLGMGIGGSVRMRAWYDFAGSMPANGFSPYLIPVPGDPAHRRRLGATPGGTSLYLRVIGRNPLLGDVVAYVKGEFSGGDDNHFKLKKAYVTLSDWTIGYTNSVFDDPAAEAPTIDGAGQAGKGGRSAVLVRWDHRFRGKWSMGAGAMIPSSQVNDSDASTEPIDDWFPDIGVYGQFNLPHDGHVRLAGLMRVLPYRDLIAARNRNRIGWGVQLSSIFYPVPRLAVYAEANTGRGYSTYMGDLEIDRLDLMPCVDSPGKMYTPWAMGLNIGCKYNFRPNLYACMALAEARYFDRYNNVPDRYKYGLYGSWSLFWEPTPRMQVGAEYLAGKRVNSDGTHGSANRVDVLFQFSF